MGENFFKTGGGFCGHLGFEILRNFAEILRNFAEILRSVAILRSRFCRDLEKFAVNLRSQKKKKNAVPTSKFFKVPKGRKIFHYKKT